jgi:hypothetical protein
MTTGKALNGKPYAGNPHVRFDEGEVAPAATPRRESLLYTIKTAKAQRGRAVVFAAIVVSIAFISIAGTVFVDDLAKKSPVSEKVRGHENTEWQIAYAYHLTDASKGLPRVLLVGDSICNGYQIEVCRLLNGKVNVSYWVSSYCVTSPNYLKSLELQLEEAKYDVVHFNNGLHSLQTPTEAYEKSFRAALELIRRKQPGAKIVWCSSTPLKDARMTAKAKELNEAAAKVVASLGGIATNDLFALLDPLDREQNWSDTYHHKAPVRKKEAEQVAASVMAR